MMTIGSLFSGIGGLEWGLERALGAETIWQVEQDDYCRRVLAKHWPDTDRSITDVRDAGVGNLTRPDLIAAGFPCQGVSVAGLRKGLDDERTKLWWECYRVLAEIRPRIVVLENVSAIVASGIAGVVIGVLSEIGYDCEWTIISAEQLGAPHLRKRWFCVGYLSDCERLQLWDKSGRGSGENGTSQDESEHDGVQEYLANSDSRRQLQQGESLKEGRGWSCAGRQELPDSVRSGLERFRRQHRLHEAATEGKVGWLCRRQAQSGLGGITDGVPGWVYGGRDPEVWERGVGRVLPSGPAPHRAARLKALGNAVVPACSYEVGLRIRQVLCQCTSDTNLA